MYLRRKVIVYGCFWKCVSVSSEMNAALSRLVVPSLNRNVPCVGNLCKRLCTSDSAVAVKYPPIQDLSYYARKYREYEKWHEKIKALPTVEEKLLELNMPSYYGWRCFQLKEGVIPYDFLNFTQFVTRTHMMVCDDLPISIEGLGGSTEKSPLLDNIRPVFEEALIFESCSKRFSGGEDKDRSSSMVKQIVWRIMSFLSRNAPHLADAQVDHDPRIEAFWVAGGMEPTYSTWKSRKNCKWHSHRADDYENRFIQYEGAPFMQLRHPLPLSPVVDLQNSRDFEYEIPHFKYDPRVIGIGMERRHGTIIPGFWPGDPCEFGLVSFHARDHINNRPERYGEEEHAEALHAQAILASYGWLYPLACYQGFSTFNDVTYPLVTQTVITDGQFWSFYTYQLNTTLVHSNESIDNPRRNLCWGTPAMKLYDKIEDGKVEGLNEEVLRKLLKIFLNKPSERDVELKPYLSDYRYVANIPDLKKREWLETRFKHLYSLRPRHKPLPEVYNWEKIYKIDHKTRPMDPRRRPFELDINPFKRRLDEHQPAYIPKKFREDKKKKWSDTYYP
ncbi:39S ribosomal protein S30, mitochondrial [Ischnura elegans]|uniref:39S ribosomal protein S30, mitochondrial n=1 Tax=Ischnura elegans TaxID=197161 RepID=UPI001ED86C44|nr:39S ribosomal protein S30, mitochondrial [Ischnura elegans]